MSLFLEAADLLRRCSVCKKYEPASLALESLARGQKENNMKLQTLRSMDYLEYLCDDEAMWLKTIECDEAIGDIRSSIEAGEKLQIVRELKQLVTDYGKNDWEQRYNELVEVVAQRTSQDKK